MCSCQLLVNGTEADGSWTASMNVNVLPLSVAFLPDTSFFGLMGVSHICLSVEFINRKTKSFVREFHAQNHLLVNKLCQSNVCNASSFITEQMNVWIQNRSVDGSIVFAQNCGFNPISTTENFSDLKNFLTVFEVELVEIHSLDQISHRFWLKRSQMGIANFTEIFKKRFSERFMIKSQNN